MENNNWLLFLAGVGAGAALTYLLDPDRGARRRAGVINKVSSAASKTPDALGKTGRDLANRAYGLYSQASSAFASGETDDVTLENRVRSKIGRVVSHPRAIYVAADNGTVQVWGNILADEVERLLACVRNVAGVQAMENKLTPHKTAGNIPDLQTGGGRQRRGNPRSPFFQEHWSPAERVAAGTAGGLLVAYGLSQKNSALCWTLSAIGAGLLVRSATNIEAQRLVGAGGGRRAVTVEKAINVAAPPDVVFALWSNFENFPKFMTNVREIRRQSENLSRWTVAGPAGIPVEWDAEITKAIPNELIAWKSVKNSGIANAGYVRFDENADGTTRVTARISYNPPAGAIGHAVAAIFGADPKTEMDADLMRMKMLLETGIAPKDAAQSPRRASENNTTENFDETADSSDSEQRAAAG